MFAAEPAEPIERRGRIARADDSAGLAEGPDRIELSPFRARRCDEAALRKIAH